MSTNVRCISRQAYGTIKLKNMEFNDMILCNRIITVCNTTLLRRNTNIGDECKNVYYKALFLFFRFEVDCIKVCQHLLVTKSLRQMISNMQVFPLKRDLFRGYRVKEF